MGGNEPNTPPKASWTMTTVGELGREIALVPLVRRGGWDRLADVGAETSSCWGGWVPLPG
jgi:hypothetical protein